MFNKFSERFNPAVFSWVIIWGTLILASLLIIFKGPALGNDSYSYMQMYVSRPPGYPVFLLLLKLFGDSYLSVAVIVQTLLNAVVFAFFLNYISKRFNIRALQLLFLLPLVVYFFILEVKPQMILTEAIAFPLFLFMSTYFIDGIIKKEFKSLIIVLLLNTVLVLIRGQFLFVYPLVALAGLYVFMRSYNNMTIRKFVLFAAVVLVTFISQSLINRVYHYFLHDTFADTQTNMSFSRNALYITQEDDYLLFEDEIVQSIHRELFDSLYEAGYNMAAFQEKTLSDVPKEERRRGDLVKDYHDNLILIGPVMRSGIIQNKYPNLSEVEFHVKRDEIFKEFSATILSANISTYLYLIAGDIIYYGFNGNRAYIVIFILLFAISLVGLIKQNKYGEIISFFLTAHLMNLILMALANRVLGRYSIYIHFILLSLLVVFFIKMMVDENNEEWFPSQTL